MLSAASTEGTPMKLSVPACMSLTAVYIDTAGFLALQGLFAEHVTVNFVTLVATLALGTAGTVPALRALPVFCAVGVLTRLIAYWLPKAGLPILRTMLSLQFARLVAGAAVANSTGPDMSADGVPALVTGLFLVCAMAIQNAAPRIHLANAPPTTLMSWTTTQIMIDRADLCRAVPPEARLAITSRMSKMLANVAAFALGCAAGAVLYSRIVRWCFVVPRILAFLPFVMRATREHAADPVLGAHAGPQA
jgi:uncharacterized membrane protein YoaK (UPF0700 family)